ncbi:15789_t:CDS:1, partial [Dentiscutata heterogama]
PDESQTIQHNYLEKMEKKIFAMAYIFENSYQCCQKMAYKPFKWLEDPKIPKCCICNNCNRCIIDNITWCNISKDLIRILDTVDKLLKFLNDLITQLVNFGYNDIVDIFMKAKNKNVKEKT